MLFFKKNIQAAVKEPTRAAILTDKIRQKVEEISQINEILSDTVAKTQAANVKLALKLQKQLKSGKRSFISLAEKLKVGVLIINYKGEILQINSKGRELICNSEDCDCVGHQLFETITSVKPIDPPGDPFLLNPRFFRDLSTCVIDNCALGDAGKCIADLPCAIHPDEEQLVLISSANVPDQYMKVTFSILDNNPEELEDVSYVLVFRRTQTQTPKT